jgi:hypothetical protein
MICFPNNTFENPKLISMIFELSIASISIKDRDSSRAVILFLDNFIVKSSKNNIQPILEQFGQQLINAIINVIFILMINTNFINVDIINFFNM